MGRTGPQPRHPGVRRADRAFAQRLWEAACHADRPRFDRVFEAWLAASYAAAWRACRQRGAAERRVRAQMLDAIRASAPAPPRPAPRATQPQL